jgi:hypothetical protein
MKKPQHPPQIKPPASKITVVSYKSYYRCGFAYLASIVSKYRLKQSILLFKNIRTLPEPLAVSSNKRLLLKVGIQLMVKLIRENFYNIDFKQKAVLHLWKLKALKASSDPKQKSIIPESRDNSQTSLEAKKRAINRVVRSMKKKDGQIIRFMFTICFYKLFARKTTAKKVTKPSFKSCLSLLAKRVLLLKAKTLSTLLRKRLIVKENELQFKTLEKDQKIKQLTFVHDNRNELLEFYRQTAMRYDSDL